MNLKRAVLHGLRIALVVLLVLQVAQLAMAVRMVELPGASAVSPLLLAALSFKALLLLMNVALLSLAHRALRRRRLPARHPTTSGESE